MLHPFYNPPIFPLLQVKFHGPCWQWWRTFPSDGGRYSLGSSVTALLRLAVAGPHTVSYLTFYRSCFLGCCLPPPLFHLPAYPYLSFKSVWTSLCKNHLWGCWHEGSEKKSETAQWIGRNDKTLNLHEDQVAQGSRCAVLHNDPVLFGKPAENRKRSCLLPVQDSRRSTVNLGVFTQGCSDLFWHQGNVPICTSSPSSSREN